MAKKLEEIKEEECPYELLDGWKWERLGKCVNLSANKTELFLDSTKYVGLENIEKDTGVIKYEIGAELKSIKNVFVEGQILYGKLRPYLNKHGIAKFKGICSTDILVFNVNNDVVNKWVDYYFNMPSFISYAISNSNDINLPRVNAKSILSYVIPIPPKETQQKIVDIIESLFANLDVAQEKVEQVLAESENRRSAIFHNAFSRKLTEKWRKENNVSFDSWKEYLLKEICDKITDGTHKSPVNTEYGEYMYVTAKNIKESGIDLSKITYVTKEIHNEIYSRCDVLKGDVLYIKDGATTGIATINTLEEPFSMLSSVALLRPNYEILLSEYLAYLLNSSEQKARMINNMSGNAITRLTLTKIKSTKIIVSSIQEQKEIVHRLDKFLSVEDKVKSTCQNTLETIATMRKSILAKAFRGELSS